MYYGFEFGMLYVMGHNAMPSSLYSESSGGSVEGYFAGEREVLDSLNRWVSIRIHV